MLAIVAVLGSIALPAMRNGMEQAGLGHETERLAELLRGARALAVGQPHSVVLCPGDALGCSVDWDTDQLLLFSDLDGDGEYGPGDLARRFVPGSSTRLRWVSFRRNNRISFASGSGTTANNGSLYLCPQQGGDAARIVLSRSGRVRVESCEDCGRCAG